jgi:hypothetical protein
MAPADGAQGFNDTPTVSNGYPLQFLSGEHNPDPDAGYDVGFSVLPATDPAMERPSRLYVPFDGSLRWWSFQVRVAGVLGSAEPGEVKIWVWSDVGQAYLLTDALTWDSRCGGGPDGGPVSGEMDPGIVQVSRGQYLMFSMLTANWITWPTNVSYAGQLWIEP